MPARSARWWRQWQRRCRRARGAVGMGLSSTCRQRLRGPLRSCARVGQWDVPLRWAPRRSMLRGALGRGVRWQWAHGHLRARGEKFMHRLRVAAWRGRAVRQSLNRYPVTVYKPLNLRMKIRLFNFSPFCSEACVGKAFGAFVSNNAQTYPQ